VVTVVGQSNAAPKLSTNKHGQDAQAFWDDDDDDYGAETGPQCSNVRKKIRTSLTALVKERDRGVELDYLINTTKGLVASNNEIWNRVKANLKYPQNKHFTQLDEKPEIDIQRVGFSKVKAFSIMDMNGKSLGRLKFISQGVQQTEAFSVPCFPHSLRTVVIPSLDKDGMLNYLEYLKRSFILEESIMLPFLAVLKDHLEEFQVFLGNVESWLMESTRNAVFLQKTFRLTLESCELTRRPYAQQIICYSKNDESQYKLSFDISNDNGRKKLTTFLAFLTQVG